MPVFISLLRGINVGGNNIIKMNALREVYESLGFKQVQTHLQSGNVIFETKLTDRSKVAKKIEDAIEKAFDLHSDIILRDADELRKAIAKGPWSAAQLAEPGKLLVLFLSGLPDEPAMEAFLKAHAGPEEIQRHGVDLFIYFPVGQGQSKLNLIAVMKKLKTSGTGRNWNTVTRLLSLADAIGKARL